MSTSCPTPGLDHSTDRPTATARCVNDANIAVAWLPLQTAHLGIERPVSALAADILRYDDAQFLRSGRWPYSNAGPAVQEWDHNGHNAEAHREIGQRTGFHHEYITAVRYSQVATYAARNAVACPPDRAPRAPVRHFPRPAAR